MECKITSFERILKLVKPLPQNKIPTAIDIILYDSFDDFLYYCIENNCFSLEQSHTLYDFITIWEDLEGNYHEEDRQKLSELYDAVGITADIFNEYKD